MFKTLLLTAALVIGSQMATAQAADVVYPTTPVATSAYTYAAPASWGYAYAYPYYWPYAYAYPSYWSYAYSYAYPGYGWAYYYPYYPYYYGAYSYVAPGYWPYAYAPTTVPAVVSPSTVTTPKTTLTSPATSRPVTVTSAYRPSNGLPVDEEAVPVIIEAPDPNPNLPPQVSSMVTMTDQLRFEPAMITINVGETVAWKNTSQMNHTVTCNPDLVDHPEHTVLPVNSEPFDSGKIAPGQTFVHTFTVPGTYIYICMPHEADGMIGIVHVRDRR